jgi:hypothetical protein
MLKSTNIDIALERDDLSDDDKIALLKWAIDCAMCPPCGIDKMTSRELWSLLHRQDFPRILKAFEKIKAG